MKTSSKKFKFNRNKYMQYKCLSRKGRRFEDIYCHMIFPLLSNGFDENDVLKPVMIVVDRDFDGRLYKDVEGRCIYIERIIEKEVRRLMKKIDDVRVKDKLWRKEEKKWQTI